jgi:hypothetical protein
MFFMAGSSHADNRRLVPVSVESNRVNLLRLVHHFPLDLDRNLLFRTKNTTPRFFVARIFSPPVHPITAFISAKNTLPPVISADSLLEMMAMVKLTLKLRKKTPDIRLAGKTVDCYLRSVVVGFIGIVIFVFCVFIRFSGSTMVATHLVFF